MKSLTLDQLKGVWQGILDDPDAKRALAKLKRDGFGLDDLMPHDLNYPCWADYIASIPYLPNRPSRRQLHRAKSLRKHLPLVKAMRHFASKAGDPFCEMRVVTPDETLLEGSRAFGRDVAQAAKLVEKFISCDWYTRDRNKRNSVIASLRGMIRLRTGNPHDRELGTLIDAAFRAAGFKRGLYLDATTLDRIENLEKEGRVKATCRLNYLSGLSPTSDPGISLSTRFPRNRKERV